MSRFRATIEFLLGYTPGEQPQRPGFLKLNSNENPYPPSPKVLEAVRQEVGDRLRLYPDPLATRFRETASHVLGVPADWIVATNGSDEALAILARACLSEPDLLVAPVPSYPIYRVLAQLQGCRYAERPFSEAWTLPDDFAAEARLAVVPNPNSPSGTAVAPSDLCRLAQRCQGLFIADEAYADFAEESCLEAVQECDRLVVTRSLSKSYSLAGIRFGYIVAQPSVTRTLLKVKEPYNCDALSIAAASAALADQDYFRETRKKILATRERLAQLLVELGFAVTPSQANFVWARRREPVRPIYEALKDRRILIRYFCFAGYGEGLRISVGTDGEVQQLAEALQQIV